jgi:hypothetical protein
MRKWVIGFLLGTLLLANAMVLDQPLAFLNGLAGVFLYLVIMVNYYGKK